MYAMIGLIVRAVIAAQEERQQYVNAADMREALARAQLRMLQQQLQPHFLFNALNNISALIAKEPAIARRMLSHLSTLLRSTLAASTQEWTTVRDEEKVVRSYLALQKLRFGDRIGYTLDIASDAADDQLPPLIIQSLVENAVLHGVERAVGTANVDVSVRRRNGFLHLTVRDDGPGVTGGMQSPTRHSGIGLSNVAQRLGYLYKGAALLRTISPSSGGFVSEVDLPVAMPTSAEPGSRISNELPGTVTRARPEAACLPAE